MKQETSQFRGSNTPEGQRPVEFRIIDDLLEKNVTICTTNLKRGALGVELWSLDCNNNKLGSVVSRFYAIG